MGHSTILLVRCKCIWAAQSPLKKIPKPGLIPNMTFQSRPRSGRGPQPNPALKVDLGYAAAFPIILIGPGLVGSLWSVFLFKASLHSTRGFGTG